jgi:hypothetical protein
MVKVLIYSSKEIYDSAPFAGRAEAQIVAYREGDFYHIMKNRTSQYMGDKLIYFKLNRLIEWAERDEWNRELARKIIKDDDSWEQKPYPDTYLGKQYIWDFW